MNWTIYPIFLGVGIFFIMVYQLYALYRNDKFCEQKVHLIIVPTIGKGIDKFVSKEGNSISIPNKDGTSNMWVLSKLNAFPMSYPPGGFRWLRRDIQTVVLSEESWEPLSNSNPGTLIGSPRFLGTLFNEKVAAAIVGMGKEFTDALKTIKGNINPMYLLLGAIVIIAANIYSVMKVMDLEKVVPEIISKLDIIIKLLGE